MWESFSAVRCRGESRQEFACRLLIRFVSSSFDVFCLLAVKRRLLLCLPKQTPHQATLIGRHDVASLRPRFAERFLSNSLRFARNIPTVRLIPASAQQTAQHEKFRTTKGGVAVQHPKTIGQSFYPDRIQCTREKESWKRTQQLELRKHGQRGRGLSLHRKRWDASHPLPSTSPSL